MMPHMNHGQEGSQLAPSAQSSQGPRTLSHMARIRILAGHTQGSLAAACSGEVSRRTIQRLESGGTPTAATAVRISRALGYADPAIVFPELLEQKP